MFVTYMVQMYPDTVTMVHKIISRRTPIRGSKIVFTKAENQKLPILSYQISITICECNAKNNTIRPNQNKPKEQKLFICELMSFNFNAKIHDSPKSM